MIPNQIRKAISEMEFGNRFPKAISDFGKMFRIRKERGRQPARGVRLSSMPARAAGWEIAQEKGWLSADADLPLLRVKKTRPRPRGRWVK